MTDFQSNAGYFNPSKVLEITLNNGKDPLTGKQIGPETVTSELLHLCSRSWTLMRFSRIILWISSANSLTESYPAMHGRRRPLPAPASPMVVWKKGQVLQRKGADHRYSAVAITGIANIADSLAAIEECVFNQKYLSMNELMDLLATDFEGKENMRQLLINKAPKYGNDIESVDRYAHWLTKLCNDQICKHIDGRDAKYTMVISTQSYNVVLGQLIGALPDGRKAYTALADNASPMIGMDTNGPTGCGEITGQN